MDRLSVAEGSKYKCYFARAARVFATQPRNLKEMMLERGRSGGPYDGVSIGAGLRTGTGQAMPWNN